MVADSEYSGGLSKSVALPLQIYYPILGRMNEFLTEDLWPTITRLSRKSNRSSVAVAYLGAHASELLHLKEGDTLVVAMSMTNVRLGQVNPFEVEKFYKKGVLIFNRQDLHSKVYVFGDKALVGSANISSNSSEFLVESAILTDEPKVVSKARRFVDSIAIERVEESYIELCKRRYNPPPRSGSRRNHSAGLSRLWIVGTVPTTYSEDDEKTLKRDQKIFENKVVDPRRYEVSPIRCTLTDRFAREAKEGDIIIEFAKHNGRTDVLKPKRILGKTIDRKRKKIFVRVEERKRLVKKSWGGLKRILRKGGSRISKNSSRLVRSDEEKKILLGYFKSR